jgi:hypothetical protein
VEKAPRAESERGFRCPPTPRQEKISRDSYFRWSSSPSPLEGRVGSGPVCSGIQVEFVWFVRLRRLRWGVCLTVWLAAYIGDGDAACCGVVEIE